MVWCLGFGFRVLQIVLGSDWEFQPGCERVSVLSFAPYSFVVIWAEGFRVWGLGFGL